MQKVKKKLKLNPTEGKKHPHYHVKTFLKRAMKCYC